MSGPLPTSIVLHQASRVLEVGFDTGETFRLPCEYLRVESPSAEVQGHHPSQRKLVAGKRAVGIRAIDPVGQYAILLRFDDGHQTGIYSWRLLYQLGREQAERWPAYLAALEQAGLSRD
ncbi:MAG: DUF971 domain-containing protein [Lysobacteraceae bacterium]|jgi:DUF971 family protein